MRVGTASDPRWRDRAWLGAVLAVGVGLRLSPLWAGCRWVWGEADDWMHLAKTEALLRMGPVCMLRVLYVRDLNTSMDQHLFPGFLTPGFSPLAHLVTAYASYVIGLEWAVRLIPILFWLVAGVWLYRLARALSFAPRAAALAVGFWGFAVYTVQIEGLHFAPVSASCLLAFGFLLNAYLALRSEELRWRRIASLALWTLLTVIGYGPNLFHIGAVAFAAAGVQWLLLRRNPLPLIGGVAAGFAVALPFFLHGSYHPPGGVLGYFRPYAPLPRLEALSEVAKYPVLIGPLGLALACLAIPSIAQACRKQEPWAIWLMLWLLIIAPQTTVWIFVVPAPPSRLVLLLIPAVSLAAAKGFERLVASWKFLGERTAAGAVAALLLSVLPTAIFLAEVEIPRRLVTAGQISAYQKAATLPADSAVFVQSKQMLWYFCHGACRLDIEYLDASAGPRSIPANSYCVITDSDWRGPAVSVAFLKGVVHASEVLYQKEANYIVRYPGATLARRGQAN